MKFYFSLLCIIFSIAPLLAMEGLEDATDFLRTLEPSEFSLPHFSGDYSIPVEVTIFLNLGNPITRTRYFKPDGSPKAVLSELNQGRFTNGAKEMSDLERIAGFIWWGQTLKSNDPIKENEDKPLDHWVDERNILKLQCQGKATRKATKYEPRDLLCILQ